MGDRDEEAEAWFLTREAEINMLADMEPAPKGRDRDRMHEDLTSATFDKVFPSSESSNTP